MSTHILLGAIVIAAVLLLWLLILIVILCYYRRRARRYNQFIYNTYSYYDKPTPAIVERIQVSYIDVYNKHTQRWRFLTFLFKPMPKVGSQK